MSDKRLKIEDLDVASFAISSEALAASQKPIIDIYCCTGCASGCGINPTAGGCESGGGY